jgi:hypothetical protein
MTDVNGINEIKLRTAIPCWDFQHSKSEFPTLTGKPHTSSGCAQRPAHPERAHKIGRLSGIV